MFDYSIIKKMMFIFEPETAHTIAEYGLRILPNCPILSKYMIKRNFIQDNMLNQKLLGVEFKNPIGLGAGFDKNATMIKAMPQLGFGYTEIGTITPKPQYGNIKPRLFRYKEFESIQNAMGFNNKGADEVIKNLHKSIPYSVVVGVSIGKNKTTPQNLALKDYEELIKKFKDISDYLAINISSPNTPNLRDLQNEEFIKNVFTMAKKITNKPILLKIAPDIDEKNALTLCKVAVDYGASGIIIANTTQDYSLLPNSKKFGGISGAVLSEKSYKLLKVIGKELHNKTTLISVGGISNAKDAYRRIKAGASLIQILSGLIFKGPSICKNINKELISLLKADGYTNISQAIGVDFLQS
jgi:dihydroorotate dehydrogenase